jgi:hypothetical protein
MAVFRDHFHHLIYSPLRPERAPLSLSLSLRQACTAFSPYNVMYSGWVGDDDSSFLGLRACAHKVRLGGMRRYF